MQQKGFFIEVFDTNIMTSKTKKNMRKKKTKCNQQIYSLGSFSFSKILKLLDGYKTQY